MCAVQYCPVGREKGCDETYFFCHTNLRDCIISQPLHTAVFPTATRLSLHSFLDHILLGLPKLDVPGAACELERTERLGDISGQRRRLDNHERLGARAQRILQQVREL